MPLPTPEEIVALYQARGVKARVRSWVIDDRRMCPMALLATQTVDPAALRRETTACVKSPAGFVAQAIGAEPLEVLSFLAGYDGLMGDTTDTVLATAKPDVFREEAVANGIETRRLLKAAKLIDYSCW